MIMSFISKKDIQGVDAVTTEDFIKFKIFNPFIDFKNLLKLLILNYGFQKSHIILLCQK